MNLLKYVLNLDPMNAEKLGDPVETDIDPAGCLRMTVTKNPAATDVTLFIQVAGGDLSGFSADGTTIDQDTPTVLRAHDNTPVSESPSRYIRLSATRN